MMNIRMNSYPQKVTKIIKDCGVSLKFAEKTATELHPCKTKMAPFIMITKQRQTY